MTLRCVDCGRLLKRSAFDLPARDGVHKGGALGPSCAKRRGFLQPKRMFTVIVPRQRRVLATPQIPLEFA